MNNDSISFLIHIFILTSVHVYFYVISYVTSVIHYPTQPPRKFSYRTPTVSPMQVSPSGSIRVPLLFHSSLGSLPLIYLATPIRHHPEISLCLIPAEDPLPWILRLLLYLFFPLSVEAHSQIVPQIALKECTGGKLFENLMLKKT